MSDAMVDLNWLCNWLEENSSGVYRPAKDAAHVIRTLQRKLAEAEDLAERIGDNLANAEIELQRIKEQKPAYKLDYKYDEGNEDPDLGGDLVFHQLDGKDYPIGTLFYAIPMEITKENSKNKFDYWHMKYDELLTKTVTLFDENIVGFLEWYEKNYDAAGGLNTDLVAKAWVDSRHLMRCSARGFNFGSGLLVVETGKYDNKPCVFVRPAKEVGNAGEKIPESEKIGKNQLAENEIVLTFPSDHHANTVADALVGEIKKINLDAIVEIPK